MKQHHKTADQLTSIVKTIDARALALPAISITPKTGHVGLRANLEAAMRPSFGQSDVLTAIKELRAEVKDRFTKAKAELAEADREADALESLSAYIKGEGHLSEELPSDIRSAALAVKSARDAGIPVSPTLVASVDDTIRVGRAVNERLKSVVDRREAATAIGLSKCLSARCAGYAEAPGVRGTKSEGIFKRASHRYSTNLHRLEAQSKAAQKRFNRAVKMEG